jgi:hypothetical protein
MTPVIFSGLMASLFLIVVLLIGVSCLYDVKTNDRFLTNNLFVGKESWMIGMIIRIIYHHIIIVI